MADKGDGKDSAPHENLILAGDSSGNTGTSEYRIKPNPFIDNVPVYVPSKKSTDIKNTTKLINHLQGMVLDRTGRVQHDDPVIEAVIGQQLGDVHIEGEATRSKGWVGPRVRGTGRETDEAECMLDNPNASTSGRKHHIEAAKVFDICLPSNQRADGRVAITLAPSLLDQSRVDHSLPSIWGDTVLMPGMVLLKGWLSIDDQVRHYTPVILH